MFDPDGSAEPVVVALEASRWQEDSETSGVVVCDMPFRAELPGAPTYEVTVNGSEPLVFTYEDIETQAENLRFMEPSQFFDPGS